MIDKGGTVANRVVQLLEYYLIPIETSISDQFLLQILNDLDDLYQFDMLSLFTTVLNHQKIDHLKGHDRR